MGPMTSLLWPSTLALLLSFPAGAQLVPSVSMGFGMDTTSAAWSEDSWHSNVPHIYRAWREYLSSQPGGLLPNPRWSEAEQEEWPGYDLTAGAAYNGASATVLDIRPAGSEGSGEFVVKTLFARTNREAGIARPVALTRVYATQEDGRWVFGNALLRTTKTWVVTQVGPITYMTEPGRPLDWVRAHRVAALADSISATFEVPVLESLTYYVAPSPERLHQIMGIDWTFGGLGYGYANPANRLLLNGDPVFGEENRHELVHIILGPITAERRTHGLISEGIATWYGGSNSQAFPELMGTYAEYLADRPEISLETVLESNGPDRGWNPAGAALVDLVHERGGISALKALLRTGRSRDELREGAVRILGIPWEEILRLWREQITLVGAKG